MTAAWPSAACAQVMLQNQQLLVDVLSAAASLLEPLHASGAACLAGYQLPSPRMELAHLADLPSQLSLVLSVWGTHVCSACSSADGWSGRA